MAQPQPYVRRYNFTNFSTTYPSLQQPGTYLDAEFNAVKVTTDQIAANLKLIQRDDGQLGNQTVGVNQLKTEVTIGLNQPVAWTTGVSYAVNDTVVVNSTILYRCLVAHVAGTFATDLAAGKWLALLDVTAAVAATGSFVSGTFTGNGSQTAFNLGKTIVAPERVLWIEGGVIKIPGTDYTVSGTTLTRLVAPANLAAISWRLFGSASVIVPGTNTVGNNELQDASVGTAELQDGAVTAAKIAAGAVDSTKLAAGSVTSAAIADGGIGTIDLADGAVTEVKRASNAEVTLDTSTIISGTADLSSTTVENVVITGAGALTALGVLPAGRLRRLRIAGTPLFTYNATSLPLPGGVNYQAVAGDVLELLSQGGGNYTVVNLKKNDGTPIVVPVSNLPFPAFYLR